MRFYKHIPEDGDTKIVKRFLVFPKRIRDEVRWLEFAKIKYQYSEDYCGNYWSAIEFLN